MAEWTADELAAELPDLIANAMRQFAASQRVTAAPLAGTTRLIPATVESVDSTTNTATLQLDQDPAGVLVNAPIYGSASAGDRVLVALNPDGGSYCIGKGGGGNGNNNPPPSTGSIAVFESDGVVIPTVTSKIKTMTEAGQIGAAILTLPTFPLPGRSLVIDVTLQTPPAAEKSIWKVPAHRPHFTSSTPNPLIVAPDVGLGAYNPGDLLRCYVKDGGSARDLLVDVTTDTLTGAVQQSGGPLVGTFIVGDGTIIGD